MIHRRSFARLGAGLAIVLLAGTAHAGKRAYVASGGLDTNPCTRQLPCRNFAAALQAVAAGGAVLALDSAEYGPVAVTKAVTLTAPAGVQALISVNAAAATGVDVNLAAAGAVTLQNLTIDGIGGTRGIFLHAATSLLVDGCSVSGFGINGIEIAATGVATAIRNTTVRDSGGTGVIAAAGFGSLLLDRVLVSGYESGLTLSGAPGSAVVRDSTFAGSPGSFGIDNVASGSGLLEIAIERTTVKGAGGVDGGEGISVIAAAGQHVEAQITETTVAQEGAGIVVAALGGPVSATLTRTVVSGSLPGAYLGTALSVSGAGASALLDDTTLSNSNQGASANSGGLIYSRGNNTIFNTAIGSSSPTAYGAY